MHIWVANPGCENITIDGDIHEEIIVGANCKHAFRQRTKVILKTIFTAKDVKYVAFFGIGHSDDYTWTRLPLLS